ncbi:MAG TPA: hypothetical protein VNY55_09425 [Mycobacterium sp.]|jgi:hypothetical protein|nr:hypothetical protein [Mycobacterium sp.]
MSTTSVLPAVVTTIDDPSNVNRKLAEEIEPRRYQTNASLSQPPTTGADRPVREYVTNVHCRANQ